ncbi:CLUMA_CG002094, isoform A [Clunio marinus]|uniref:CLUMA_CG002094, isoform A n=1 Tax=Clunio marinus TaxID=568069 RepID=A0A1J1HK65_9DIPT|nr:CLUMA_CG002094, isoform A [Clunio marinus]
MATAHQTCNVKCESYTNSIVPRIYNHLIQGSYGDCVLSAEGKFIRCHKIILSISSEYFEKVFSASLKERPTIIVLGVKFIDLCLLLDFAYLGQAQVPNDRLDDFLKAGEMLQIRGIKEGRIHFITNQVHAVQPTDSNRSFDPTISSTEDNFIDQQQQQSVPNRAKEEDDAGLNDVSEIMKMLLENNPDLDVSSVLPEQTKLIPLSDAQNTTPNITPVSNSMTIELIDPMQIVKLPTKPSAEKKRSITINKKIKLSCKFCGRVLSTQGRIMKHENECNDNPNRATVNCELCHLELKPSSLTHHKNVKHGIKKSNGSVASDDGGTLSPDPQSFNAPSNHNLNSNDCPIKNLLLMQNPVESLPLHKSPKKVKFNINSLNDLSIKTSKLEQQTNSETSEGLETKSNFLKDEIEAIEIDPLE